MTTEDTRMDEAQELVWALLDEQISDAEFGRLEKMLAEDEQIRQLYVECVQMHVDLHTWFDGRKNSNEARAATGIPLDIPWTGGDSPVSDSAF